MKIIMKLTAAAFAVVVAAQTGFAALNAPLPSFKTPAELQQGLSSKQTSNITTDAGAFFTGKPYVAEKEGYIFKYRTYVPQLSRWTATDPSGFPDGANNFCYGGAPTGGFDSLGLAWHFVEQGTKTSDSLSSGLTYTVPVDLNGTIVGSYSVSGFTDGKATSLTMTLNASNTVVGWFNTATANLAPTITFNINPTSGEVTMTGTTKDDTSDSAFSVGTAAAAYNLGIEDGTNVVQGQIAFGYAYKSGSATISIGFSGAGLEVGVEIPVDVTWNKDPTLSFAFNKAE